MIDYWNQYIELAKEPLPSTIDYHLWFWFIIGNTLQFIPLIKWINTDWPNETGEEWVARCRNFDKQDSWWKL